MEVVATCRDNLSPSFVLEFLRRVCTLIKVGRRARAEIYWGGRRGGAWGGGMGGGRQLWGGMEGL